MTLFQLAICQSLSIHYGVQSTGLNCMVPSISRARSYCLSVVARSYPCVGFMLGLLADSQLDVCHLSSLLLRPVSIDLQVFCGMEQFVVCIQTIRDFLNIQAVSPHNIITAGERIRFVQFPCHDVINHA